MSQTDREEKAKNDAMLVLEENGSDEFGMPAQSVNLSEGRDAEAADLMPPLNNTISVVN